MGGIKVNESLHKDVYRLLRNTAKYLKIELRKKIEEYDITWQQFHALYHIGDEGITANELARELNCNASNMTGIIDRMTDNGWVYREHSKEDRRVWFVKLTDEGLNLKNKLLPIHQENIIQVMSVLSEEELMLLKDLLSKLTDTEALL